MMIFFSETLYATIPEPETQISGQVYNLYQNHKVLITEAQVEWTIRKKGSNDLYTYDGSVECMACNAYDEQGLACLECETYAYLIKIPQETQIDIQENTQQTIPLSKENQQYDVASVKVNGMVAHMNFKSQLGNIQPDDKQGEFLLAGQPRRSHFYEVDLELVLPVADSDNDRIPDFWENQYGFDMNDASDAASDSDEDGWDNLTEFLNATHPTMSNTTPKLLDPDILAFEGSSSLLQLNIADSDTSPDDLMIKFVNIPQTMDIIFHGANSPFVHGHKFQQNEMIPWKYLKNGNVIYQFKGNCTQENTRLYIELIDGNHDPVIATVRIKTFKPTTTDATDAVLWSDAYYHSQLSDTDQSRQLQDRSGNNNRGNYYGLSTDGELIESEITVIDNTSLAGNPVIDINGFFELPYAKPLFPQENMTVVSVFKVNAADHDQVIGTGHYLEISVMGNKHPLHPGELRVADETNTIYSHQKVVNEWVMATITKNDGQLFIDIDGLWAGGPFSHDEDILLPGDPSIGGKNIWSWDFTLLKWNSDISGLMNGEFAEMLVYDRPLSYLEKWRIYAHLKGKWFGYVISDNSRAPKDVQVMAVSGKMGEEIRQLKAAADLAWIDYGDAIFSNENVLTALANLESYLPDNWQWTTIPPSVDEASQALDAIKFDYQNEFVAHYGKDKSYILIGGMGDDTLIGGYENDILIGGEGKDILKGSNGSDIFVVSHQDEIIDFNVDDKDVLDISHLLTNTDSPLKDYIHFEIINDLETGENHTQLKINADATGDSFDDAVILLRNVVLRDQVDIARLWASSSLHTGGSRPDLKLSLSVSDNTAAENPEDPAVFHISFSEQILPDDLTVPLSLEGSAILGQDYQLCLPVWNDQLNKYESTLMSHNIIPVKLKKGDQQLTVKIIPIPDKVAEPIENISLSLSKKEDYYLISNNELPAIDISDGIDEISIQAASDLAIEGKPAGGTIIISRVGSLDTKKEINLLVKGTAENGRDFYYIPSEIAINPGETSSVIDIVAYQDKEIEDVEFVEVIVSSGDYTLKGASSARVAIRDSHLEILAGDMDNTNGINLKDAIIALQVCAGKDVSSVYVESSIGKDRIGIKEVLYILNEIAGK
jgi:hypothetical protein